MALRAWPGLSAGNVVRLIENVILAHGITNVRMYVLESHGGSGVDALFTSAVARELTSPVQIVHYDPSDPLRIVDDMARCGTAVSMKLHSSALWAHTRTTIYPIVYAPKVAAFFGLPYSGLKIYSMPVAPKLEEGTTPRAHDVVRAALTSAASHSGDRVGKGLTPIQHVAFAAEDFVYNAGRRLNNSRKRRTT